MHVRLTCTSSSEGNGLGSSIPLECAYLVNSEIFGGWGAKLKYREAFEHVEHVGEVRENIFPWNEHCFNSCDEETLSCISFCSYAATWTLSLQESRQPGNLCWRRASPLSGISLYSGLGNLGSKAISHLL